MTLLKFARPAQDSKTCSRFVKTDYVDTCRIQWCVFSEWTSIFSARIWGFSATPPQPSTGFRFSKKYSVDISRTWYTILSAYASYGHCSNLPHPRNFHYHVADFQGSILNLAASGLSGRNCVFPKTDSARIGQNCADFKNGFPFLTKIFCEYSQTSYTVLLEYMSHFWETGPAQICQSHTQAWRTWC